MRYALAAEWTKLRTAPGTAWLPLAVVVATVAVGAAAAATMRCPAGACTIDPARVSLTGPARASLTGVDLGQGAGQPRRGAPPCRRAGRKAAVVTGTVLVAGAVAVAGSLLAGRLILPGGLALDHGAVLRAAGGSVLYLALIGLLSLGVAAAVRDSAAGIGIVLGLRYVVPIVAGVVSDEHWHRRLQQVGPMSAGLAVQATTGLHSQPIGPWAGLGVLACWAAAALLAGGLLLARRDT